MASFTVTTSVRNMTQVCEAETLIEAHMKADELAHAWAKAEASYITGAIYNVAMAAAFERKYNEFGQVERVVILRRPQCQLAAYMTPTEVIGEVIISGDFAALAVEQDAEARRLQIEVVRGWLAAGIPVPADYPVQPSDL